MTPPYILMTVEETHSREGMLAPVQEGDPLLLDSEVS